ncbi:MAG: LytTR family DNA-binding domain-containing protein [Treponema sp.]|jgi:DNA-binding LytR/AlgR family response regulator|nr:LytTR family DNA-binding domain-containing protein [Treponema sp.]
MLQIAVCDDHFDELADIVRLIDQYKTSKDFDCGSEYFYSGIELIDVLQKGKRFDIYCLDIIMPEVSGIDTALEIRKYDKTAPILFFTSSPEYAVDSYSVDAVNYVLKPITEEKLFAAFDKMRERMQAEKNEDTLIVKSKDGIEKIFISHLVYAEASKHKVRYHLHNGRVIECTETFTAACDNLLKYRCLTRPHHSYLVNMQYIKTIEKTKITLQALSTVPVAQGKAREIKDQYLAYQREGE